MNVLIILSFITSVYSYNFLVYCPLFAHSHSTFFGKIADILTDAGHNVTFFSPTTTPKYRNMTYTKSTKNVVHLEPTEKLAALGKMLEAGDISRYWVEDSSVTEIVKTIQIFQAMYHEQANVLNENLDILDSLKNVKFDVMIFESYVASGYPLMEYLNISTFISTVSITHVIQVSQSIGEPVMPSAVSDALSPSGDKLGFVDRAMNLFTNVYFDWMIPYPQYHSFLDHKPINILDEEPQTSYHFINSNPYLDFPRPTLSKTVHIGGISVDVEHLKSQKVDQYWDTVLNKRKHTVLVSFGSLTLSKDMPMSYKIGLATAMKNMSEVTFIWKYEDDDTSFANNIPNIEFSKWVPQSALLADDRLTAFLTHGGLGSVNELSYMGKPAILCPLFADQMRNAKMLCRHNGSIEISKYDLSNSQLIQNALDTIINDKSYQLSAIKLSKQLNNQPIKPYELLIKHAEFAAQFGRLPSLDPYSRQMSFVQYFLIDVITTTIIIISIIVLIIYHIITKLVHLVRTKIKQD